MIPRTDESQKKESSMKKTVSVLMAAAMFWRQPNRSHNRSRDRGSFVCGRRDHKGGGKS